MYKHQLDTHAATIEACRYLRQTIKPYRQPSRLKTWPAQVRVLRKRFLSEIYLRGYPQDVLRRKSRVVWGDVLDEGAYRIRKLRYEIYPDYWVPALLYEPAKLHGKTPVVLNSNGHHAGGKACEYKQARCINLALRGMIAMNFEFIGMGELVADAKHFELARLDLTGLASSGMFYLAMKRALDILLDHKHADPKRCAMTGLSGGGWQTIVLSALDPRITTVIPVAGYMNIRSRINIDHFNDIGDCEQCPPDLAGVADYGTLTAMLAPRATLQITNEFDNCCFATPRVKRDIYTAMKPLWKSLGSASQLQHYSNTDPGTHNYESDNRQRLYRFLNEQFALDAPTTDLHDDKQIHCDEKLAVGLPSCQKTLDEIAFERAKKQAYEHQSNLPRTALAKRKLRENLKKIIRLPKYKATGPAFKRRTGNVVLKANRWSVPATYKISSKKDEPVTLAVSDIGRAFYEEPTNYLKSKTWVAIDLFDTGENVTLLRPAVPMLVHTAGQRCLGIQVAQILAVAQLMSRRFGQRRIRLQSVGPVTSTSAMMAAALYPGRFSHLSSVNALASFRHIFDLHLAYESSQPLYCPDLLLHMDIPQIRTLLTDVQYDRPETGLSATCSCR